MSVAMAALLVAVTGAALSQALFIGTPARPLARVCIASVLGVLALAAWAGLLSAFGALAAGPLWIGVVGLAVGSLLLAWRRGGLGRRQLHSVRAALLSPTTASALLIAGVGTAAQLYRQLEPGGSAPQVAWVYFGDVLEMLTARGIPEASIDYGIAMGFETNKLVWYLVSAAVVSLGGLADAPYRFFAIHVGATTFVTGLAAYWLASQLTRSRLAAFFGGAVIAFAPVVTFKLSGFRGEAAGIALLFLTLAAARAALDRRERAWVVAFGACVAALVCTHLVPAVAGAFLGVGMVIARVLERRRAVVGDLARASAGAVGGLVVAALFLVPAGGGAAGGQKGLSTAGYSAYRGKDPTSAFARLVGGGRLTERGVRSIREKSDDDAFYVEPEEIRDILRKRFDLPVRYWPKKNDKLAFPVALLLLLFLWLQRGPSREIALAAVTGAALLYALALWFSWRYETWLPAEHALRRELHYLKVYAAIFFVMVLDGGMAWLATRARPAVAVTLSVVIAGYLVWPQGEQVKRRAKKHDERISKNGHKALRWLRDNTSSDARILLDAHTDGVVQVNARRVAIPEGRAPYFQPDNLTRTLEIMEGAAAYWRDPSDNWRYLVEQDIDYVVSGAHAAFGKRGVRGRKRPGPEWALEWKARFGGVRIFEVVEEQPPAPEDPDAGPVPHRDRGPPADAGDDDRARDEVDAGVSDEDDEHDRDDGRDEDDEPEDDEPEDDERDDDERDDDG